MTKKTVVVTGIGAISPLAATAKESWAALLAGESGITRIEDERYADLELPVEFAGQARRLVGDETACLARVQAARPLLPALPHRSA
jgi:3-oxoacyl-[acyl-carrier-protein] synthase II